jgi:hypothetical protein
MKNSFAFSFTTNNNEELGEGSIDLVTGKMKKNIADFHV